MKTKSVLPVLSCLFIALAIVTAMFVIPNPVHEIQSPQSEDRMLQDLLHSTYEMNKVAYDKDKVEIDETSYHYFNVYQAEYEIPEHIAAIVPANYKPYVNKSGLRILALRKAQHDGKYKFCKIDNDRHIECTTIASAD